MLKAAIIVAIIILAIAFLMPLCWQEHVVFDWPVFVTEWYKGATDLLLIFAGFILAHVVWETHKQRSARKREESARIGVRRQWCMLCREARGLLVELDATVENGTWTGYAALVGSLNRSAVELCALAELIRTTAQRPDEPDWLPQRAVEYLQGPSTDMSTVLLGIAEGRLIPRSVPPDGERAALNSILGFFERTLESDCARSN